MSAEPALLMTSSAHRTHLLPVEHLDYRFIQQCRDVKYLEKILRVLRAGTEGVYPHLTEFCEKRIESLDPKRRALRKDSSPATPMSMSPEEWNLISEDLQAWQREITTSELHLTQSPQFFSDTLPPVHNRTQKPTNTAATKRHTRHSAVPRSYSDWDKLNVDSECTVTDECVSRALNISHSVPPHVSASALTQQEKKVLSTREKEKGNEAYRAGDWDEAIHYYTRSVCILPTVAVYNNRAQAEIKLQRWTEAVTDCNIVLKLLPLNNKALLRRATAHTHLGNLHEAYEDITTVLKSEPNNPTAQKLLCEVKKKINPNQPITSHQAEQPIRGKKLVIQEVEDEDEDEEKKDAPRQQTETPPTPQTPPTINTQLTEQTPPTPQTPTTINAQLTEQTPPTSATSYITKIPSTTRRTLNITEEEDDADDADDDDDGGGDDVIVFNPSNAFEFGQALKAACCRGDGVACAQLLRSVLPWKLPQLISTQLDTHTLCFITHTLHTLILHSEPSRVYQLLTHLHTAERFTVTLMLMDSGERRLISDLFECLSSVQCDEFTPASVTQLFQKYTTLT